MTTSMPRSSAGGPPGASGRSCRRRRCSRDRPSAARAANGGSSGGTYRPYLPASRPPSRARFRARRSPAAPRECQGSGPRCALRSASGPPLRASPRALATRGAWSKAFFRRDVGIEAAGRSRHGIGGDEGAGGQAVLRPVIRDAPPDDLGQILGERPEVAPPGPAGVIALPRRGGPGMEISRAGESLGDQARSQDLSRPLR